MHAIHRDAVRLNEAAFGEFLIGHGVSGAAQPIVDATTRKIVGYEFLGREVPSVFRLPKGGFHATSFS